MSFVEIDYMQSLLGLKGYEYDENILTEMLTDDNYNIVQGYHLGIMFVFQNYDEAIDYLFLRTINDIISEYKLEVNYNNVEQELNQIYEDNPMLLDRITKVIQYLYHKQIFKDENEATMVLFITAMLIQNRVGTFMVPPVMTRTFYELMDDDVALSDFILHFCIDTTVFGGQ